jgi:hypothetical protein
MSMSVLGGKAHSTVTHPGFQVALAAGGLLGAGYALSKLTSKNEQAKAAPILKEVVIEPPLTPEQEKIMKVVNYLLMESSDLDGVISKSLAKKILIKCDDVLFKQFSHTLQKALDKLDLGSMDTQKELFIANIISLLPYAYPKEGDSFLLPIKNDEGIYERKSFTCHKIIKMSLSTSITPLNAYALKSEAGDNMLLFTGTTFPAGSGFLNSLIADFTAFSSVGKLPFGMGKKELKEYFASHRNVLVFGMSLGGALSLHALRHFETSIKEVFAVVPAGLHFWDGYNKDSDKKVVILMQEGDIVSKLGYFPEHKNVELFKLTAREKAVKGLYAHARAFSGSSKTQITRLDVKKVNRSFLRRITTVLHVALSWLIFLALMPVVFCYKVKELSEHSINKLHHLFTKKPEVLLPC